MKADDLRVNMSKLLSRGERHAIATSMSKAREGVSEEDLDEVYRWAAGIRFRSRILQMVLEGSLLPYWDKESQDVRLVADPGENDGGREPGVEQGTTGSV